MSIIKLLQIRNSILVVCLLYNYYRSSDIEKQYKRDQSRMEVVLLLSYYREGEGEGYVGLLLFAVAVVADGQQL